jgi:hypothetical protein
MKYFGRRLLFGIFVIGCFILKENFCSIRQSTTEISGCALFPKVFGAKDFDAHEIIANRQTAKMVESSIYIPPRGSDVQQISTLRFPSATLAADNRKTRIDLDEGTTGSHINKTKSFTLVSENTTASNNVILFPIFLKLHVVGSTTFTDMLRCLSSSSLYSFSTSGPLYWDFKRCGHEQGHESAAAFSRGGVASLACCADHAKLQTISGADVRFITLLRHPLEKFLSSVFTFANPKLKKYLETIPTISLTTKNLCAYFKNNSIYCLLAMFIACFIKYLQLSTYGVSQT